MVEKTVRRGTKLFDKAIDGAKEIMAYDLDNAFRGSKCIVKKCGWTIRYEVDRSRRAMLTTVDGVYFTLRIHRNLWFSWGI